MELNGQVLTFLMTIVTGMLLGGLFDCYRVLRRTFKPKVIMTWLADLLYWLVATAVMFVALLFSNWGELRFYVFIGVLSGLGVYYRWLSLYAIRFFFGGISFVIALLNLLKKFLFSIIIRPGLCFIRITVWPFMFICKKIKCWYQTRCLKPPDEKI